MARRSVEVLTGQFLYKISFAEAVFCWMFEERAIKPGLQRFSRYLFEEKPATWFENTPNFGDAILPNGYVVEHSEIENCFTCKGNGRLYCEHCGVSSTQKGMNKPY